MEEKAKKAIGRPAGPPTKARNFRFLVDEAKEWAESAARERVSLTEWLRRAANAYRQRRQK